MALIFAGSLQIKKKGELQSLALALKISTEGNKEEVQTRIKKYLDENQSELEEDPQFSGLFDRRRKRRKEGVPALGFVYLPSRTSSNIVNLTLSFHGKERFHNAPRVAPLEPVYESTPVKDLSDVSALLKNPPLSPSESDGRASPSRRRTTRSSFAITDTPCNIHPSPPSPDTSSNVDQRLFDRTIIEHIPIPRFGSMLQVVKRKQEAVTQSAHKTLYNTRTLLSNSRTIWSISVLVQLLYISVSTIPWRFLHIPFSATSIPASLDIPPSTVIPQSTSPQSWRFISITIPYPPLATFESSMFWIILLHWFIPTVLIPVVAGILISFRPLSTYPPRKLEMINVDSEHTRLARPFDPLTASIVQLAAQVAYTFPAVHRPFSLSSNSNPLIKSVDILGFKWRVLSASVVVALSFAEALAIAGSFESSHTGIQYQNFTSQRSLPGAIDTIEESEVD
ncbi:hypothetical protein F5876DRAFT_35868 [Lentinula aff. lateritia]|uniref:Uncharacterized protein n=1 Tax=Lentinula aff. lateritia TaxID=2804960 RepID=A0ACC1U823_9AGAR|nr:hypothetical protein F5876DRAFT_35868 [Lentinula aff. lateritia]